MTFYPWTFLKLFTTILQEVVSSKTNNYLPQQADRSERLDIAFLSPLCVYLHTGGTFRYDLYQHSTHLSLLSSTLALLSHLLLLPVGSLGHTHQGFLHHSVRLVRSSVCGVSVFLSSSSSLSLALGEWIHQPPPSTKSSPFFLGR